MPSPAKPPSPWQREPFRLFFVLGIVLSWIGVGHWLLYGLGVTKTYSCESHASTQMQGFMMAFAVGFLFTALPRRTDSAPASRAEIAIAASALVALTVANVAERWGWAQAAYGTLFAVIARFAAPRLAGRSARRRPPAAFVLIPIAAAQALGGALLIAAEAIGELPRSAYGLGHLFVQQGVFLCLVVGVGNLILPLMGGTPPPPDLGSSPRESRRQVFFVAIGIAIVCGIALEQIGYTSFGPLLRATAFVAGVGRLALRPPGKPGLHRRMTWIALWCIPLGLTMSALLPDYRVAALHLLFIGGFGAMALSVGSHVSLGHLDLTALSLGRPWPVIAIATTLPLALLARLAADPSEAYFAHLTWAAAWWLLGTAAWLAFFAPKLLRLR